MNELILRDLDECFLQRLQETATAHGVTVEEEAKYLLTSFIPPCIDK